MTETNSFGTIVEFDEDLDAVLRLTYQRDSDFPDPNELPPPPPLRSILTTPKGNKYYYDTMYGNEYQKITLCYSNTSHAVIVFDFTRYAIRDKTVSKYRLEYEIDEWVKTHPRD